MKRAEWDELADDFETGVCDIAREETNDRVRRYVAAAGPPREDAVLVDLGCGIGSFIQLFGNRFRDIVGVEFAPRIIARAKLRCATMPGVTWLTMDIPRAAAKIGPRGDLSVCLNVITQDSTARRAVLWASVAAVTRRGGHALVVVPSLEAARLVERIANPKAKSSIHADGLVERDGAMQKHFARRELDGIFADNGFAAKRIGRAYYPWAKEGMRETKARAANRPWDWICLAKRV